MIPNVRAILLSGILACLFHSSAEASLTEAQAMTALSAYFQSNPFVPVLVTRYPSGYYDSRQYEAKLVAHPAGAPIQVGNPSPDSLNGSRVWAAEWTDTYQYPYPEDVSTWQYAISPEGLHPFGNTQIYRVYDNGDGTARITYTLQETSPSLQTYSVGGANEGLHHIGATLQTNMRVNTTTTVAVTVPTVLLPMGTISSPSYIRPGTMVTVQWALN